MFAGLVGHSRLQLDQFPSCRSGSGSQSMVVSTTCGPDFSLYLRRNGRRNSPRLAAGLVISVKSNHRSFWGGDLISQCDFHAAQISQQFATFFFFLVFFTNGWKWVKSVTAFSDPSAAASKSKINVTFPPPASFSRAVTVDSLFRLPLPGAASRPPTHKWMIQTILDAFCLPLIKSLAALVTSVITQISLWLITRVEMVSVSATTRLLMSLNSIQFFFFWIVLVAAEKQDATSGTFQTNGGGSFFFLLAASSWHS